MIPRFAELAEAWRICTLQMVGAEVHNYGNVAVLTYNETVSGRDKGQPSQYTGKVTMVYVRQHGSWRGVHYHESVDHESAAPQLKPGLVPAERARQQNQDCP